MNKIIFIIFLSFPLYAQWEDKSDGCGLGWKVTDSKTFSATTTRTTTNVFIPPTFGMSSGTMGCDTHGLAQKALQKKIFVAANFDHILQNFSQGRGEYIDALISFYSCPKSKPAPLQYQTFLKGYLSQSKTKASGFLYDLNPWLKKHSCY